MKKKILCAVLALTLLLLSAACGKPAADSSGADPASGSAEGKPAPLSVTVPIRKVSKYGNLILEATFDSMKKAGFAIGDILTATVGEQTYDLPVGANYTDVDNGAMLCRFDSEDGEVGLAINMGSFAEETGAAEKQETEEDPGYRWEMKVTEVTLTLKEKGGYLDQYNARNLARTNDRADYAELTDAEFANFRAVSVSGLKENTLYRGSSPLDPDLGRNEYVMAAMENAGIKTVVNLADPEKEMKEYKAYPGSYYSSLDVLTPEMNYDFGSEAFAEAVKQSVSFLAEHDGPFFIHCKEGKDRTGVLSAVLECFAGASWDEVKDDYMLTYRNFYGVTENDTAYDIVLNDNLVKTLCGLFGVDSLEGADLKEAANKYLRSVGLSEEQLAALAEKLTA